MINFAHAGRFKLAHPGLSPGYSKAVESGHRIAPRPCGIDVIIVAPGPVKTPIWSKAEEVDISVYRSSPFFPALQRIRTFMLQLGENGLPAEKIAETIADALTAARPKVRYQITPDPIQQLIVALLPKRLVDRIIAKRLGLMPPA